MTDALSRHALESLFEQRGAEIVRLTDLCVEYATEAATLSETVTGLNHLRERLEAELAEQAHEIARLNQENESQRAELRDLANATQMLMKALEDTTTAMMRSHGHTHPEPDPCPTDGHYHPDADEIARWEDDGGDGHG